MNYNNFKVVAKYTIAYGVLLIMVLVLLIFSKIEYYNRSLYLLIAGVTFATYLLLLAMKPHFFGIQLVKDVLEVRFYNPHPFVGNYKQIKIPLSEYDGYEVVKTLFGPRIIFKIKRGKRTGQYPPLSLSAVGRKDREQIFKFLDNLKAQHQSSSNN